MRLLFTVLIVLIASVGVALVAARDPGYVLITRGPWVLETSLGLALALLVITFAAGYGALRLAANAWKVPHRLGAWRRQRRTNRARRLTQRGLIQLAEGNWRRAERDLVRVADDSDAPVINYLSAARAAQQQDARERRDHYLSLAHRAMPDAELAVGLTQAEVRMAQGQWEQALATLMHLRSIAPRHKHVLALLRHTYEKLGSWRELAALTPDLRRNEVFTADDLLGVERLAHARLLDEAGKSGQVARLREAWEAVPRPLHDDTYVAGAFARNLACLGQGPESEELLRDAIKRQWDPELVRLYGLVRGKDLNQQLATAEGWLKRHEHNALLLLTLGRICLHNRLWGKARTYLEASLGLEPRAETYRELGVLLSQFKEQERATDCFRKGLELSVGTDACTAFKVEDTATARAKA